MTIIPLRPPPDAPPIPDRERDLLREIDILEARIRVLTDQRDRLITRVLAIKAGRA